MEARHDFKVSVEAQLGLALYVLFGFLWAIQLCKAISWTSMSSAVCYWFVMDSAKGGQCGKTGTGALRLLDATWTILSKHRAPAPTAQPWTSGQPVRTHRTSGIPGPNPGL